MFAALITFVVVTDKTLFAVYGLILIIAHELGHILMSVVLRMRIREINFGIANIDICKPKDYDARRFSEKVLLILGGCIFNIVIFLILWLVYLRTKKSEFLYVSIQSIGIAVLNILPIKSLDGGELLNLCVERFSENSEYSKRICDFISCFFLYALAVFGAFIIIKYRCCFSAVLLIFYLVYQKYI